MSQHPTTVHLIGLVTNLALGLLKFTVGTLAGSHALIADGFNSAGDVFATGVGFAGHLYSRKPPDEDHHYGHGNADSLAGLIIGGMLFATGGFIFIAGVLTLISGTPEPPAAAAVWAAVVTIVVKEGLYRLTITAGRKHNSPSLLASARDHRADVVVSLTVCGGVIAARIGTPWLDPLAAALVGLYITWMAIDPIRTNIDTLMDRAPPQLGSQVQNVATNVAGVDRVAEVRIHPLGSYYVIDIEISVDGEMTLVTAHEIAERVAGAVTAAVAHVHDVRVHVQPRA